MSYVESVEYLAERMRDTYTKLRKMFSRYYRPNPAHEKLWLRIAKQIKDRRLDGVHFVNWIFNFYTNGPVLHKRMPYVPVVTSPKSVQMYMQEAPCTEKEREHAMEVDLKIQFEVAKQRLSFGDSLRDILSDETLEIGPVVRYVLAYHGGLSDLASGFRAEAEREVTIDSFYKRILGDKLPLGGG